MAQELFVSDTEEEERQYPTILSEEEDDFDPPTIPTHLPASLKPTPSTQASRRLNRRFSTTGSMATIRVKRRAQLADKLRDIFELDGIRQVVAGQPCSFPHSRTVLTPTYSEIPCWLLRSVCTYFHSSVQTRLTHPSAPGIPLSNRHLPLFLCPHAVQGGAQVRISSKPLSLTLTRTKSSNPDG